MNNIDIDNDSPAVMWIDDKAVSAEDIVSILLRDRAMATKLVREIIIDRELKSTILPQTEKEELVEEFRNKNKLQSEQDYINFLNNNDFDETSFKEFVSRPRKIVKYREEKWGPRANSLYLKHKDEYDVITYKRLESRDPDIMQEVFFRLKDKEETWDNLAKQFQGPKAKTDARLERIHAGNIEPALIKELRKNGPGVIIKPIKLKEDCIVVAELEEIEASKLDDNLKDLIMRKELEAWLQEQCTKMGKKLRYKA